MKIILGLDMDGCLYDWHSAVHTYYQYEMKYEGDYNTFWLEYIPSLSKEKQNYICELPFLYDCQVPRKCVIDFLNYAKENSEIYYITHRPDSVETVTRRYLRRYNFPFQDNLIITGDKVTACRLVGVTHFLDDFPKQVEAVSAVAESYLMAKPWNIDYRDQFKTVYGIKEFQNEVFGRTN